MISFGACAWRPVPPRRAAPADACMAARGERASPRPEGRPQPDPGACVPHGFSMKSCSDYTIYPGAKQDGFAADVCQLNHFPARPDHPARACLPAEPGLRQRAARWPSGRQSPFSAARGRAFAPCAHGGDGRGKRVGACPMAIPPMHRHSRGMDRLFCGIGGLRRQLPGHAGHLTMLCLSNHNLTRNEPVFSLCFRGEQAIMVSENKL